MAEEGGYWRGEVERLRLLLLQARKERDDALQALEFEKKERRDEQLARSGMAKLVWAREAREAEEARERAKREAGEPKGYCDDEGPTLRENDR